MTEEHATVFSIYINEIADYEVHKDFKGCEFKLCNDWAYTNDEVNNLSVGGSYDIAT